MAYDPTLFNVDPYYDDYSDDKGFLRTLYKPGYAVQARELTQEQTVLQTQIQRFGDNIFKDGSIVTESQVVLNPAQFIRINSLTGYNGVAISDFIGLTATTGINTIKILDGLSYLNGSNVDTSSILIFSEYLDGATAFAPGNTISANYNGVTISATLTGGSTANDYSAAPAILPFAGDASLIGLDGGVRYIKGYFVKHDRQTVTPFNVTGSGSNTYRTFNNLNSTIKFAVTDTIVTATDDDSLNDPAFGSPNYAAPGADRYKIELGLTHTAYSLTADYTLIQIVDGEATYKSNYPEYNILADTLARRTYDESGNYTVEDFPISVEEHTDEGKLKVKIGKGKAYIFGYEFINYTNKILTIDKARTKKTSFATQMAFPIGNQAYISVNSFTGGITFGNSNFNTQPLFYLSSGTGNAAFNKVGSVRLGNYNPIFTNKQANFYEFTIDAGFTFGSGMRLFVPGQTGINQHIFNITTPPLVIQNTNYNSLLFPLSNDISSYAVTNVSQISDILILRSKNSTLNGGTNTFAREDFGFAAGDTWATFNSAFEFVAISATGASITGTASITGSSLQFISSSVANATIFASFDVNWTGSGTNPFYRTKTLSAQTATVEMRRNSFEEYAYLNGVVDVYDIISITGQFGAGGATTMTSYFDLDNGQKDDIYDWSRLVVKNAYYAQGITAVSVTYRKFNRSSNIGPYVANSYSDFVGVSATAADYKNVPIYTFKDRGGNTVSLAGCMDFRPDRITPASFTGTDVPASYGATGNMACIFEQNNLNVIGTWDYYYPRTDKIILNKDKEFEIVTGEPTNQALPPSDRQDAMTLGTLFLTPYTKTEKDVNKYLLKNRRYTMKDIGQIDKRVERLEYYTTLSLAEKDAKNLEIKDVNGLNRFKNGIFVDDFSSRANSNYNNTDHKCAVDPERKEVRPRFDIRYVDFAITGSFPSGLTQSIDGIITFNYSTSALITQRLASKAINVNPFNVSNFNGSLVLDPQSDDWIDTTTLPEVVVNLQGENDGIGDTQTVDFGTIWNNWETTWTGKTVGITPWNQVSSSPPHSVLAPDGVWRREVSATRYAIQETGQVRTGQKISISPETISKSIGNRIVDVSIVPYIRANTVTITAKGMRPNVRVYPFFDNTDVSSYCSVGGVPGAAITTDSEGKVGYASVIIFSIPEGTFKTGERLFRLIDDSGNTLGSATTTAEQIYSASGLLQTQENTVVSTRNLNIRRESVSDDRVFNNIITEKTIAYIDPVAQTFLIDPLVYPNGLFVKKVDVYFKSKSDSLPITLQLRPTVNGYPSSSTIIPLSEVYKSPTDINITDDASTATIFEFSSPVYLQPGEYAITILSNSDDYEVWVAEVGQDEIASGERISSQPYTGSFFKSQNSSTWTAEQSIDLKFIIHKCDFTYNGVSTDNKVLFDFVETDLTTGLTGVNNGINVFRLNSTYIEPASTYISTSLQFPGVGSTEYPILNSENYTFQSKADVNDASTQTIRTNFLFSADSSSMDVTPILDTQRVSGLYIQNLIRIPSIYKDSYEVLSTVKGLTGIDLDRVSLGRHITKKVNLQQGFESTNLDVYMSIRKPRYADFGVYLKSQAPTDNTNFDNLPYEKLSVNDDYSVNYNSYISAGDDDFVDVRFSRGGTGATGYYYPATSGVSGQLEFKSFQVKVVFDGDPDNSVTPAFKDLKILAT